MRMHPLIFWLIALLVLPAMPVMAQSEGPSNSLEITYRELDRELDQMGSMVSADRERLLAATTLLPSAKITSGMLEDARLDLAALLSRKSGLQTRLKARRGALSLLETSRESLLVSLQDDGTTQEQAAELEMQISAIEMEASQLKAIENKLEELSRYIDLRVNLARQRLNALQARFELPDLNEMRKLQGVEAEALRKQIDSHLLQASAYRNQLTTLDADDSTSSSARRLLELKALTEEERAEFKQMSLARMQADRLLNALASMLGTRSTPVRVIEKALDNLSRLDAELAEQGRILASKRRQFTDQIAIVQQQAALSGVRPAENSEASLAVLRPLMSIVDESEQELTRLKGRLSSLQTKYVADRSESAKSALLLRSELPADAIGWQQLGGNLLTLPLRVASAFEHAISNFLRSIASADSGSLGLAFVMIGLLCSGVYLSRVRLFSGRRDGPLALLNRHIYALLPPLILLILAVNIGLRDRDLLLLMTPLSIYPVVRLALDFANNFLDVYTPELDKKRTAILLRETRWTVILVAVLAAVLVCAQAVALAPAVIDVIDRIAMLCLLLVSIPLLHLRALLMEGISGEVKSGWVRSLTLLLPLLLAICALAGLLGYVNLANSIASRVGLFALFAVAIHYIHLVMVSLSQKGFDLLNAQDEESAVFWNKYFFEPARRVLFLLAVVGAGNLLFSLFGWNAQTPIVRVIPLALNSTVFTVGESPIYLKTLLLGILIILAAVWGAGWTRQVSYRWVYTRVDDQGLRNSLATFTQYLVVIVGVVAALKIIGLDLTALTVFAGALGVGIGFGMQQIVVNFISGILLLIERPLSTTDQVAVDKYEGEVTRIGIRSLTVKTWDSQEVIIPNSAVITKPFTNWTRSDDIARTILMIGISYDDEPQQAIDILKTILVEHPAIIDAPAPKVLLWDYADSALMIRVQFHSRIRGDVGRGDLRSQILLSIWDAFKKAGITIPYPQRDVHHYMQDRVPNLEAN